MSITQSSRGYGDSHEDSHGCGYGDYDESPWVCGDSMGTFESRCYKKLKIAKDEM